MAFQDVNSKNSADRTQKATALAVGESILGYVTNIVDSQLGNKNIVLKSKDGSTTLFFTAGNLRYMLADGKVSVGLYTRITRIDDKMVNGKKSTQFKVEQDATDLLTSAAEQAFLEATEPEETSIKAPSAAIRAFAGIAKSAQPKKI